jgi:hypothetical protein
MSNAPLSILVQTMEGTAIEHPDHEPTEAELAAVKQRYIEAGHDVVSVRTVEDARLSSRVGPHKRSTP